MSNLVLVATDGGKTAASAIAFAAKRAEADGLDVEILAVVEPLSELPMPLPHRHELELAHAQGVAERVRQQLRDTAGITDWPVHIRLGRPAPAIWKAAEAARANLVVLGLDGRRAGASGTAVELLHLTEIPVYIARTATPTRTVVVGVDFRPSSLRAAREALRLAGPDGALHLVHVQPSLDFPAASVWDWTERYQGAVADGFERLTAELEAHGARNLTTHARLGDPADDLLQLADDVGADLVAIGSDGYICNGRVVVGRVARRLIVDPPLPVLAMPVLSTCDAEAVVPEPEHRLAAGAVA